jgi:hypothetical protein
MRELARDREERAFSRPSGSPTLTDLYLFFPRRFEDDAQVAEGAVAQYVEGNPPDEVGKCIQQGMEMAGRPTADSTIRKGQRDPVMELAYTADR